MIGAETSIRVPVPPVIGRESAEAFVAAMNAANRDNVGVIVLEGRDGVFCKGLEIASVAGLNTPEDFQPFRDALVAVRLSPHPVIAAVDGAALGGGLGLAAAADLVIATEDSTFGLPESRIGLAPALILPFLEERMTPQQRRLWALTPHARSAADAARVGLVDLLTNKDRLEETTQYWVRQLSRATPASVRAIKGAGPDSILNKRLGDGIALSLDLLQSPEVMERLCAYE